MSVATVNDKIVGPSRGSLAQAVSYAKKANAVDAPAYLAALWANCQTAGLDALILTAQWCVESDIGRSSRWRTNHNPAGLAVVQSGDPDPGNWTPEQAAAVHVTAMLTALRQPPQRTPNDILAIIGTTPGAGPFFARWTAKFNAPQCPTVATIADLCTHYTDATGEAQSTWAWDTTYAAQITEHARNILAQPIQAPAPQPEKGEPVTYPTYAVAGLATRITLPVPLIQAIIPTSQTNQRPGIKRQTPGFWVQHETANTAAGADAAMHARYLANGGNGGQVSWHFTVDDHQIYQHIPIDEVT